MTPDAVTVSLGAGFVPAAAYAAFVRHLLPVAEDWMVSLTNAPSTGWRIDWKAPALLAQSVANTTTWGTRRCDAMTLLSLALRLDSPIVHDKVGDGRQRNTPETAAAQAKLADIREEWSRWWRGSGYAAAIVNVYSARFSAHPPRQYDGSSLAFPGLAAYMGDTDKPLQPRRHQLVGAARIVEQGDLDDTVLLTYHPGAGKTLTAVLGIVKRVQAGLTRKACVVVPRHVVGQWRDAFSEFFPGMLDRFLVADDDFSKRRRDFLDEVAQPHIAVVVVSYEQFRTIGLSAQAYAAYYSREVDEVHHDLIDAPDDKALLRELKRREAKLEKLRDLYERKCAKQRDGVCWEDLGFDLLCLDEIHYCKAIPFNTRMSNVSGLPRSESQRAVDAMMKIHWTAAPELYGPHGVAAASRLHAAARLMPPPGYPRSGKVVGLTGTPVTNTLAEVWGMLRIVQPRLLRERGLWHFDAFAAVFCEQVATVEMDSVGRYRTATRLAWRNIPELQALLSQCWDRARDRSELQRPGIATGRMRFVEVQGSEELRQYVRELADRADRVRCRLVDPADDNMLKITHDGRVAGLFNGPGSEAWPTDRRTKVDACADVVWNLYCKSDARRGVVLIFCDLFTPKAHSSDDDVEAMTPAEQFMTHGVYGVLRQRLQQRGIRADEVAFVHDAESGAERDELFRAVRRGTVRVLVGSTQKLATGVNVQDRVYGMVHLTVPWRPDWLTQADARGDRDGNLWATWGEAIHSVAIVTVGSYDVVSWQMIEQKAAFISQIVNDEYEGRTADDVGDLVITANVAKAIALGDLRIVEKTQMEVELSGLARSYRLWREDEQRRLRLCEELPVRMREEEAKAATLRAMIEATAQHPSPSPFTATLRGSGLADVELVTFTDRAETSRHCYVVAERLRARVRGEVLFGEYRGAVLTLDLSRGVAVVSMQWAAVEGGETYSSTADITVQLVGGDVFATLDHKLSVLDAEVAKSRVMVERLRGRLQEASAPSPPWAQRDKAAALLAKYESLCDGIAASQSSEDGEGVVERKRWSFSA